MHLRHAFRYGFVAGLATILPALSGCGSFSGNSLPATVLIELPDGTAVEAAPGDGAPSLANSTWQFYQTSSNAQALVFLTVTFGPEGNLEKFDENSIAPEVLGDTIVFDGNRYPTNQSGVTYEATSYGAGTADGTGVAFEGRLVAFAAGLTAATANASASGVFDPLDPMIMTGTLSISTRSTFPGLEQLNNDVTMTYLARRVQ